MSEPWEDFEQGASVADAPSSDAPPWEDFSKVKISPEEQAKLDRLDEPTGNTDDLTRALVNDPVFGFDKNSPGAAPFGILNAAGNILRAGVSDAMTTVSGHPEYGGNLRAIAREEPLPADVINSEISKAHPFVAAAAKTGQGFIAAAPMAAAALPEGIAQRLVSLGFSADMLHGGVDAANQIGEELGKNPEDRDMDKLTSAVAGLVQSGAFSPLAGAHGLRPTAKARAIGELSAKLLNEPVVTPELVEARPAVESVSKNPWDDFKESEAVEKEPLTAEKPIQRDESRLLGDKPILAPALLVEGQPATGGSTHKEIYDGLLKKAKTDDERIAAHEAQLDDAKHVFVDQSGKVYDRREAADALGLKEPLQSEVLKEVQANPLAIPEQAAQESGYNFVPGRQIGSVKLEGLTDAERKMLEAEMPVQWEFTNPKTGITFYMPEGASKADILARAKEKDAESPPLKNPSKTISEMSQDEYATYLADGGLVGGRKLAGQGAFYRELVKKPEFREVSNKIPDDVQNELYTRMDKIRDTSKMKESGGWNYINFGDSKTKNPDGTRSKSYITFKNPIEDWTPELVSEYIKQLSASGYNGAMKTIAAVPFSVNRIVEGFDNIVNHGRTQADADLAAKIAKNVWGDKVAVSFGLDPAGTSHTDALATAANQARLSKSFSPLPRKYTQKESSPPPEQPEITAPPTPQAESAAPTPDVPAVGENSGQNPSRQKLSTSNEKPIEPETAIPTEAAESVIEPLPETEPEFIGLGGAVPSEFIRSQQSPTSTKNAQTDIERGKRGLPPAVPVARREFGTVWDEAVAALDLKPDAADNLIASLQAEPRAVTDFENALLLNKQIELQNRYSKVTQDLAHAYDDAKQFPNRLDDVKDLKRQAEDVHEELYQLYDLGRKVGTETGRGLNARKMFAYEDYTLAKMELARRAANEGKPLTEEQQTEVKKLHDRIADLQSKVDAYKAAKKQLDSEQEADAAIDDIKKDAEPVEPHIRIIANKVKTYFDNRAMAAQKRLSGKTFSFEAALPDLIDVSVSTILSGAADFTIWSSKMLEKLDKSIEPHLKTLWEKSQKALDEHLVKATAPQNKPKVKRVLKTAPIDERQAEVAQTIQSKFKAGKKGEISGQVQKLVRLFVEQGITGRDALIDAVHGVLSKADPAITRRDAMDAISGYGDFKQLSKDAISAQVRDLKGQIQQVAKLEDIQAKKPPLKTGVERRTPSDEERRLIQQVNEAKRRFGVVVTDPATQLRGALEARKKYYENQISDLETKIKDKQKFIRTRTPSPTDAALEALKSRRDELKRQFDEAFKENGLTDKEKLEAYSKSLDSRIKEIERQLRSGEIFPPGKSAATFPLSEAVKAKKAALYALIEQRKYAREAAQPRPEKDSEAAALKARKTFLKKKIEELQSQIESKQKNQNPKPITRTDFEIQEMEQRREELKKEFDEVFGKPELSDAQKLQRLETGLDSRIAEVERQLKTGEIFPKGKKPSNLVLNDQIKAKEAQLGALKAQRKWARDAAQPRRERDEDMAALKAVNKQIETLENQLKTGAIFPSGKTIPVESKNELVQARKAQLAALKEQRQWARESAQPGIERDAGAIALKSLKTRMRNQLNELEQKIKDKDYTKKPKREPVKFDKAANELFFQLDKAKREWHESMMRDRIANRKLPAKILGNVGEALNTFRAIMTSADLSAVLRQGGFITLSHPVRAAKAFPAMFKALRSEAGQHAVMQEILHRPNFPQYMRSKLYIAENGQKLSQMEEAYMSRWADKIPLVAASQRAYVTFLNKLRADSFDAMEATLSRDGEFTQKEANAVADFINTATGRATFSGKGESLLTGLNTILFAPRYVASRFQLLAGTPLWRGNMRTRSLIAQEYGRYLIGAALVYGLGALAGGNIGTDPNSADFLKLKYGNTRLDPMSGLLQATVFLSRLYSNKLTNAKGQQKPTNFLDTIKNFARSKLAPVPGAFANLMMGKDVTGKPVTAASTLKNLLLPIGFQDIYLAMKEQGVPEGTIFAILSLFGAGVQTYGVISNQNKP